MSALDALWHVLNFFAPALGVGLITATLAKLLWWRDLKNVGWVRFASYGVGGCAVVLVMCLVLFGRDGKMSTYLALVLGCAIALWWVGWMAKKR